jgi:hypothetical protein
MSVITPMSQIIPPPDESNDFHAAHVRLLLDSYQRLLGRPLLTLDAKQSLGKQVFEADFVLASHDTAADPLFNYGNNAALDLFEFSWEDFMTLPSRHSAEAVNQEKREKLLAEVARQGFVEGYSGVRIAKSGKRFVIKNAVVWNVYDEQGDYHGQAACFADWAFIESFS